MTQSRWLLTAAEFEQRIAEFDPERHDFFWSADGSQVEVVKLLWYDQASYQHYQGDGLSDEEYARELSDCRAYGHFIPGNGPTNEEQNETPGGGGGGDHGNGEEDIPF
jgi:hypothetical protein